MAENAWKLEAPPPVEHRLWGLDRRLMWPTVAVLAVVIFWSAVVPAIDEAVNSLEIPPDMVLDMGEATFRPAAGWVLANPPSPVGEVRNATLIKESITLNVTGSGWSRTPADLLDQISRLQTGYVVEGRTYTIRTAQGVSGVARKISGPDFVGVIAGFVQGGWGVAITVKGPADASGQLGQPVAEMIQSVAFKSTEAVREHN